MERFIKKKHNPVINEKDLCQSLNKSFQILNVILELKLSLYKTLYPEKTKNDLEKMINREMVQRKIKQWKLQQT